MKDPLKLTKLKFFISEFENKSKFINRYEKFWSESLHQWLVAKVIKCS